MPLKSGSSDKTIQKNIKELVGSYKKTGKIGTSKPSSPKKAREQAVAIAYSKAGKTKTNESFNSLVSSILNS